MNTSLALVGVLEEINARLAVISPEQFHVPEMDCEEGDHVVGTATDGIKRLQTLRQQMQVEVTDLTKGYNKLVEEAREKYRHMDNLKQELENPESEPSKALAEIKRLDQAHSTAKEMLEIVEAIFWLEVRQQSSEFDNKSCVGIRSDWSLVWNDDDDSAPVGFGIISVSLGDLMRGALAAAAH